MALWAVGLRGTSGVLRVFGSSQGCAVRVSKRVLEGFRAWGVVSPTGVGLRLQGMMHRVRSVCACTFFFRAACVAEDGPATPSI